MGGGVATTILVTAVVAIAVAQLLFCIVVVWIGVRVLREIAALREAATETLGHVSELAEEAAGGIHQAREAASRVGAVIGSGRSFIENAVGATVLRRLAGRGAGTGTGTVATIKTVVEGAVTIWKTIANLRRPPQEAAGAEAPPPAAHRPGGRTRPRTVPASGARQWRRVSGPASVTSRRPRGWHVPPLGRYSPHTMRVNTSSFIMSASVLCTSSVPSM